MGIMNAQSSSSSTDAMAIGVTNLNENDNNGQTNTTDGESMTNENESTTTLSLNKKNITEHTFPPQIGLQPSISMESTGPNENGLSDLVDAPEFIPTPHHPTNELHNQSSHTNNNNSNVTTATLQHLNENAPQ